MPDDSNFPLIPLHPYSSAFPQLQSYNKMSDHGGSQPMRLMGMSVVLFSSYVFDWLVLAAVGGIGLWLGLLTPNKRPFQLENNNISFPFTEKETVPMVIAGIANTLAPVVIIIIIALVFVPGATVPPGTPKQLIWRRKLWELHMGLLGLALSCVGAWFVTNAMKNMFGKPRPDFLARCQPDFENVAEYVVGGIKGAAGQMVSPNICQSTDKSKLNDGFRSFPSGHASSSSAGLLYLSLFIASKFSITIPFLAPASFSDVSSFSAFPSRLRGAFRTRQSTPAGTSANDTYEMVERPYTGNLGPGAKRNAANGDGNQGIASEELSRPSDPATAKRLASHARTVAAVRLQAAAPPLYLLLIACIPTFGAIYIAGSRWFDFRHHAFDIIVGFLIGVITAVFAFRYYHLPISQGAGWAWGPRSHDKAYWAGVGSFSYATNRMDWATAGVRPGDEEEALNAGGDDSYHQSQQQQQPRYQAYSSTTAPVGYAASRQDSGSAGAMKRGYEGSLNSRTTPPPARGDSDNRI